MSCVPFSRFPFGSLAWWLFMGLSLEKHERTSERQSSQYSAETFLDRRAPGHDRVACLQGRIFRFPFLDGGNVKFRSRAFSVALSYHQHRPIGRLIHPPGLGDHLAEGG